MRYLLTTLICVISFMQGHSQFMIYEPTPPVQEPPPPSRNYAPFSVYEPTYPVQQKQRTKQDDRNTELFISEYYIFNTENDEYISSGTSVTATLAITDDGIAKIHVPELKYNGVNGNYRILEVKEFDGYIFIKLSDGHSLTLLNDRDAIAFYPKKSTRGYLFTLKQ